MMEWTERDGQEVAVSGLYVLRVRHSVGHEHSWSCAVAGMGKEGYHRMGFKRSRKDAKDAALADMARHMEEKRNEYELKTIE